MSATQLRWFAALLWSPWKMQKTSVHVTSESGKIQQDNKHNKWKHHEILGTNDFIILTTYLKGPSKLLGKNEKAMRRATLSHPEAMSACARGQQWVWVPGGPICGFVWTSKRRITNYVTTLWLIHNHLIYFKGIIWHDEFWCSMLCVLFSILLTCVLPSEIKLAGLYFLDSKLQIPGEFGDSPGFWGICLGNPCWNTCQRWSKNVDPKGSGKGNTSVDAGDGWILLVDLIL